MSWVGNLTIMHFETRFTDFSSSFPRAPEPGVFHLAPSTGRGESAEKEPIGVFFSRQGVEGLHQLLTENQG